MSRRLVVLAIAATAVPVAAQRADTRDEPIRLIYRGPDCTTEDALFERLRERAQVERVSAGRVRTFEIAIDEIPGGMRGTLIVQTPTETTSREVEAATCEDAASALIVIAALAVAARPAAVEPPPRTEPAPSVGGGVAARAVATERTISIGTGIARFHGITPDAVLGASLFVALGRLHGPRLRAAVARTQRDETVMPTGRTELVWTTARIDATPYAIVLGRFDLAGALGIEAGMLEGRGTTVAMADDRRRPWIAPDAALRLRARFARLAIELEGMLAVPLVRDRFFIAPSTTVHEVPWITAGVGVTLAVGL